MGIFAGVDTFWMKHDNEGRYHSATKAIIQNGLVLNLDAGVNESYPGTGTTWTDLSGNGNDGTLTNGPTFNSANGGSIVFDGTDDWVLVDYTADLNTSDFTACVWCRPTGGSNNYRSVITNRFYTPTQGWLLYADDNNNWSFWTSHTGKGNWDTLDGSSVTLNEWIHLAITMSSGTKKLFENGVEVATQSVTYSPNPSFDLMIGAGDKPSTPQYELPGKIVTVAIYNRSLSADEIRQNYNVTKGRFE